jgi:hypothetical protein
MARDELNAEIADGVDFWDTTTKASAGVLAHLVVSASAPIPVDTWAAVDWAIRF